MRDDVVFRLDLPHGRCVGVTVPAGPAATAADVPVAERALGEEMPPGRRESFAAGRLALRLALVDRGFSPAFPLLPLMPPRGGPQLPTGALGSISHKRTLAVGLAAPAPPHTAAGLGVDVEDMRPLRFDLGHRVLTPRELELRDAAPPADRDWFVLARFSLKEAFYKAVNAWSGPRVSFQALEVTAIAPDGGVTWSSPLLAQLGLTAEGHLCRPSNDHLLATAFVRAR